ncbi:hypothetical protein SKAU_G00213060 [Synaphobranchus kaupii]|uniref:Uncharacterized protein n=1 Tax=Synaphobranchus kaupii TaxID=118154 RepID=A0A9Q1F953_SYNKA|nr:hypothetical protein SKAU_G00213060 [Synaphobranchus kaupii]
MSQPGFLHCYTGIHWCRRRFCSERRVLKRGGRDLTHRSWDSEATNSRRPDCCSAAQGVNPGWAKSSGRGVYCTPVPGGSPGAGSCCLPIGQTALRVMPRSRRSATKRIALLQAPDQRGVAGAGAERPLHAVSSVISPDLAVTLRIPRAAPSDRPRSWNSQPCQSGTV